jgi:hypothetical protein
MSLHSKFLIHWTGKDFCDNADTRLVQDEYVKRLRDTCERGFYMQKGREEIWGVGDKWIKPDIGRVCFSEIGLSRARSHAERYGGLGIGVHRSFILEREGNPVFYVQNGKRGHMVEQFAVIHANAESLAQRLEQSHDDTVAGVLRTGIRDPLRFVMGYVKNMSDRDDSEMKYYDEMEWRVVHVDRLMGRCIVPDEEARGVFRLLLSARDVRIIVFPDDATRLLALKDEFLKDYFMCGWPIVTTLNECGEF